ncbi:hypothetical protein FSARC_8386 [Fusarium sarcochroum]|uniref:2EXR domain-containing protein n=1 Tax=Fusarium sarcochroum TaxID=1208366 RepID=A0A8H4X796_9HYPO|nr:hypothetical protein FSARC_8386 [Fusarium sarcochroum]
MASRDVSPAVESHLRIINPVPRSTKTFPLFARFPAEIRGLIWEQALSHERILYVSLGTTAVKFEDTENQDYGIYLNERMAISKLFCVTSESRRVALTFYRVRLPCRYMFPQRPRQSGILYICPELDTIRLRSWEHLDKFAHDVWMADPRGVGLVNLCLSSTFWNENFEKPDVKGPHIRQSMSRLERVVIFEQFVGRGGRNPPTRSFEMNRAIPILVAVPSFDRLASDPRLRDEDLRQVYMGRIDPRKDFHRWFQFLAELQVQHDHKVDYRFALCHSIGGELERLVDQQGIHKWLVKKEAHWRERVQELKDKGSGNRIVGELNFSPQPAVGFWLFRMESLGPLPDINETNEREAFPMARVLDMSQHKPELCLSNIY